MLPAPTPSADDVATLRAPIEARRATLRDVPRLAAGHTAALAARRTRAWRWLTRPALLATALQLIGPTGRGEVFRTGYGSSLRMTPATPTRTPVRAVAVAALTYLLAVVLLPLAAAAAAVTIGGPAGTIGLLGVAAYLLAITAAPLLAASRTRVKLPEDLPLGVEGSVRLHDLVRHPRDAEGTGVALLSGVIHHPDFSASTITTTAASTRLADAYQAAGMTRRPNGVTLYRLPHTCTIRGES